MAGKCADWNDHLTKAFLDLCIAEKEKLNYVGKRRLTKLGWQNLYSNFQQQTGSNFDKKQLQNKFNGLKRLHKVWRRLKSASGGGWDSTTGTIRMDDDWWQRQIADDELAETFRKKPLQFQDELDILFGTTNSEEGSMFCVGGIGDRTPSNGSDNNTPVSEDNIGRSSVGLSGQRSRREQVVDSPPAKRNKRVEYYVERLSESLLQRSRSQSSAKSREEDEVANLLHVVEEDGVDQDSELYFIATCLFKTPSNRAPLDPFVLQRPVFASSDGHGKLVKRSDVPACVLMLPGVWFGTFKLGSLILSDFGFYFHFCSFSSQRLWLLA